MVERKRREADLLRVLLLNVEEIVGEVGIDNLVEGVLLLGAGVEEVLDEVGVELLGRSVFVRKQGEGGNVLGEDEWGGRSGWRRGREDVERRKRVRCDQCRRRGRPSQDRTCR